MSRSSYNTRPPENREYWVYVPSSQNWIVDGSTPPFIPTRTTQTLRGGTGDPWTLFEERLIGGANYGLASAPSAVPPRFQARSLLIDDYGIYNYEPRYYQTSSTEESRLSGEQQNKAVNKLRKQLYSPHLSNIVKRLGTKYTGSEATAAGSVRPDQDDDCKRCAVCLEDFDTKQFLMITPCNHMFHEDCIVPWVQSQPKCPVCRFVLV